MGGNVAIILMGLLAGNGTDDTIVVRVPIDAKGTIECRELVSRLTKAAGSEARPARVRAVRHRDQASIKARRLPVRGPVGLVARSVLSQIIGSAGSVEVGADALRITLRPEAIAGAEGPRLRARLEDFARNTRLTPEPPAPSYGFHARPSYRPGDADRPTICLIHGINSTSDSFVNLVPVLEAEGFGVILYDYPYDRDLDEMIGVFAREWREYRRATGDARRWNVLTHSMGALLARAYVEGDDYGEDVDHLFLIGPTNRGAAVAKGQTLLQIAKGLPAAGEKRLDAAAAMGDGLGAAAEDLLPGSKFLEALNRRPRREGVSYHILAGDGGFLSRKARAQVEAYLASASTRGGLVGGLTRMAAAGVGPVLDELTEGTGDGCVSVPSTRLEGVADHETIPANHVELIRGPLLYPDPGPVVCLPFVAKRLKSYNK